MKQSEVPSHECKWVAIWALVAGLRVWRRGKLLIGSLLSRRTLLLKCIYQQISEPNRAGGKLVLPHDSLSLKLARQGSIQATPSVNALQVSWALMILAIRRRRECEQNQPANYLIALVSGMQIALCECLFTKRIAIRANPRYSSDYGW